MSTLKVLKEYLVGKDGYLLNDDNNGKTVMLSGAWGSGKTHFWKEEITRVQEKTIENGEEKDKYTSDKYQEGLSYKLNEREKACVYISLYGKDSLEDIKQEVFFKASTENDYLSDDIEAFGYQALSTISDTNGVIGTLFKSAMDINEYRREGKGKNKLKKGGLICFDDFERKSKNIDLNDLFGFISQLAISLKCKVVVILNSDVFKGEEANVFKTVKEKTVNKFFYFKPIIKELFDSIYKSNEKYKKLDDYKNKILKAIEVTEELNARIYIQVLDNCLEWVDEGYGGDSLKSLVLTTINFSLNHIVFEVLTKDKKVFPKQFEDFPAVVTDLIQSLIDEMGIDSSIYSSLLQTIYKKDIVAPKSKDSITLEQKKLYYEFSKGNESLIESILLYFFKLKCYDADEYNKVINFVKTGILLKKEEES